MKRNLIGTPLVVLSLLIAATGAFAQTAVQANVPFAFEVGKAQLPAGTYRIKAETQGLMVIGNSDTMQSVYSQIQRQNPKDTTAKLVFHHLGNQYFLAEVWGTPGGAGMTLPTSKLEKELQIAQRPPNSEEEIEIALH